MSQSLRQSITRSTPRVGVLEPSIRRVFLIGVISGLLYIAVYLLQRAIFLNGLNSLFPPVPGVSLLGDTPDPARLRWQAIGYYGATLGLFVLYGWLLLLCRRNRLIASPGYWSWYATLPLALLALSPGRASVWIAFVLTGCARSVAPLQNMFINGFIGWETNVWATTAIGIGLPFVVLLGLLAQQQLQRRAAPA